MRALGIAAVVIVSFGVLLGVIGGSKEPTATRPAPRATHPPAPSTPTEPVAAAATFLTSLTPDVLLDPQRRASFLARWADPAARASLERTYAGEADRIRATYGGAPRASRSALLGYRLVTNSGTSVRVAIWAVGLAAGRVGTGASGWTTVTVTLRRHGQGWAVALVHASIGPGPSAPARTLARTVTTFHPFSHAR